jgi:NADH-quinone oxidoreductase subunit C
MNTSYYLKLIRTLYKKFVNYLITKRNNNDITVVSNSAHSYQLIKSLESNSLTQLKLLNDVCIVDYPERLDRFEISYNLLSVKYNLRLFLKAYTQSYIQSTTSIFASAV